MCWSIIPHARAISCALDTLEASFRVQLPELVLTRLTVLLRRGIPRIDGSSRHDPGLSAPNSLARPARSFCAKQTRCTSLSLRWPEAGALSRHAVPGPRRQASCGRSLGVSLALFPQSTLSLSSSTRLTREPRLSYFSCYDVQEYGFRRARSLRRQRPRKCTPVDQVCNASSTPRDRESQSPRPSPIVSATGYVIPNDSIHALRHRSIPAAPVDDPALPIFAAGVQTLPTAVDSSLERELDSTFVELCGGRITREVLLRHGVEKIFGYPGGAVLPVFDIVFGCPAFDFIIPRHEQGAGHMAQGYARVSGKPGVVLVTSGPGATNMITPMQDALADGIPLVVLCGQVPTAAFGTDAFQEADIVSLSRACTKWNYMVEDIEELPLRLKQAFDIATSGRPGPVLVGIPKDIGNDVLRRALPRSHVIPGSSTRPSRFAQPAPLAMSIMNPAVPTMHDQKLQAAADMISAAERPVIYAGHGVLTSPDGPELLRRLAHKANIPVTTTMHGLGAFDELDSKHALHMLGMHGSAYANLAMQKADVIIGLGARFDDRITGHLGGFAPGARSAAAAGRGGIIHFEIEPKNINKTVAADIAVQGDVADSMRKLLSLLPEQADERRSWFAKVRQWKEDYPFVFHPTPADGPASLKPQEVVESLDRWCEDYGKENVVVTTGVGQHQMWACQHYRWRYPRTLISSGGLGTMGYGLPAAIGAKRAAPEKIVVDIDGDASFVMSGLELMTASQYNIGVKVIVFNNRHQGMVIQWQGEIALIPSRSPREPGLISLPRIDFFYKARHPYGVMSNPDFVTLARSMGVHAIRCDNAADLPAKMKEFMEYDNSRPVLLDACIIEVRHPSFASHPKAHAHQFSPVLQTETVCPQVLPGKNLDDMVMHKSLVGPLPLGQSVHGSVY